MPSRLHAPPLRSFFIITAACFFLYGQTLFFDFVWDDYAEVLWNDNFHTWKNLGKFFTVPYWQLATGGFAPYHRPMIPLMICFVSAFFGKNPFGYHLLNTVLFSLTSFFYFLFLNRLHLSRSVVIAATAIFILHPAHAEAVAWGSARPVLLSSLCFILILWLSSFLSSSQKKFWIWIGIFSVYTVGLMTYHTILTLPILMFFLDWIHPFEIPAKSLKTKGVEYGCYVFFAALFIGYTLLIFHQMGETDLRPFYTSSSANMIYTGSAGELLIAPFNTLSRYAEILLFPLNLVPDVAFYAGQISPSAAAALLLMVFISVIIYRKKSHPRAFLFSIVWMLTSLLTVLNLVPQGGLFADRYAFLSSMGFALWLALALFSLLGSDPHRPFRVRPQLVRMILGAILLFYGIKTFTYSQTWKHDLKFWWEASILAPHKARTHHKLAIALEHAGLLKEAAEEYQKTLQLAPEDFGMAHKRLADVLKKLNRPEEAAIYEKAFEAWVAKAAENQKKETSLLVLSH